MSDPLLQIDKVGFGYGGSEWQLREVSLGLSAGQIIGVIGPNGAGKSTLLKIAAGLVRPSTGLVRLIEQDMRDRSRRSIARQLGFLPQNVTGSLDYRVEEIVAMGRFAHLRGAGFLQPDDLEVVERCLECTETTAYRRRSLSQLSGGERQRVLLASVLAQQPQVLLLDEPTTGLDMHHQVAFFDLVSSLAAKGMAVIVVTHDLNLAALYCHRLLLLVGGHAVKEGTVPEVVCAEVLGQAYRHSVYVGRHPMAGSPMVLPVPGQAGCGAGPVEGGRNS